MGVVARFHYGVAAVEFDEEIMIVAAVHEIDRAALENRIVLFAAGMDHRHDEIRPFTPQRLGCVLRGCDRGQECQVFGARRAGRFVIGRAGEPDAHAVDARDGAVLEVRQRLPIGAAQVGGVERELGLRHALEKGCLAEIEFVITRHENVGCEQIGKGENTGAPVEARHQRRRQRIAGMGEDHVGALGALGLDYRGEPRAAAAALPVRHHLIRHQINVIDQDEGDARGLGAGRGGAEDRDQQDAGGETASSGHGEEAAF